MARLQRDARRIAERFGLRYEAIEPESARVTRRYGSCHEDGKIKIRLSHARTGRPLKYSSMIDTLCHELAHLKHFNHGPRFRALFEEILEWARAQGIYRPSPRKERVGEPVQNDLLMVLVPSRGMYAPHRAWRRLVGLMGNARWQKSEAMAFGARVQARSVGGGGMGERKRELEQLGLF